MNPKVRIAYANGYPLETGLSVDLLIEGQVKASAKPDTEGIVEFGIDLASGQKFSIRASTDENRDTRMGSAETGSGQT